MLGLISSVLVYSGNEQSGGLLDVNPGLIIWTVITFALLFLILAKYAWKPILNSLNERENFIKDSLEKAETAKKEAEILLLQNKEMLAKAESEAQGVIAQGREYAEKLKSQILDESKNEARKMIDEATAEISRKNQEAFTSLKEQVASIAIDAAEKLLRDNLDKDKQLTVVNKYIDDLSKN